MVQIAAFYGLIPMFLSVLGWSFLVRCYSYGTTAFLSFLFGILTFFILLAIDDYSRKSNRETRATKKEIGKYLMTALIAIVIGEIIGRSFALDYFNFYNLSEKCHFDYFNK